MVGAFFKTLYQKSMQKQKNQKTKPPTIPLLELLAYNSTVSAGNLLKKHNMPAAMGYNDLQAKLKELYESAKDPLAVEKEFASIHPHREFILKYLSPPPVETKVIIPEPRSSAEGSEKGFSLQDQLQLVKSNNVLVASVAIVGIVGLVIYMSRK
jgi:hypothetical protein